MYMCIQGNQQLTYTLAHYHQDTLSWALGWDEKVRLGPCPVTSSDSYLLDFQTNGYTVRNALWKFDADMPKE